MHAADQRNEGNRMNAFEQQLVDKILDSLHEFEVKVTQELGEIHGDLKAMRSKNESDHQSLRSVVEQSMLTDTHRLNKHSEALDAHSERLAKLEEWKSQFQKQVAHRIAISQSVSAIAAVVVAFLLSKFF